MNSLLPQLAERAPEMLHRMVDLAQSGAEILIEPDGRAAADAERLRSFAKPSHGLLLLLVALRAWEFDLGVVETAFAHCSAPSEERAPEVFHRLVELVEAGSELFRIGPDMRAAGGAGHPRGMLRPEAALRAREFDLGVVETAFAHFSAPSLVRSPMVTSLPPGEQPCGGDISYLLTDQPPEIREHHQPR